MHSRFEDLGSADIVPSYNYPQRVALNEDVHRSQEKSRQGCALYKHVTS